MRTYQHAVKVPLRRFKAELKREVTGNTLTTSALITLEPFILSAFSSAPPPRTHTHPDRMYLMRSSVTDDAVMDKRGEKRKGNASYLEQRSAAS